MAYEVKELAVEELRRTFDPAQFTFASTEELPALEQVIGQDRAMRAVSFGIDIKDPGYHMYALGPVGTGKTTTIKKHLDRDAAGRPVPDDWLYLNNFGNEDKPRALRLPPGKGCQLNKDMNKLVDELENEVPRAFESSEYVKQQEELGGKFKQRQQELLTQLEKEAQEKGVTLVQTPQGLMIAPVENGNVITPDQIMQMSEEQQQLFNARQEEVQAKAREVMRSIQHMQREARERMNELDRQAVAFTVGHWIDELKERYAEFDGVVKYLDEVQNDILENVQTFKELRQLEEMKSTPSPLGMMMAGRAPSFDKYRVNLLVDNCEAQGAPVILARNPSYHNLIGRIEHQGQFGALVTNFLMIKAGLLHKANGGYLMIDVRELLMKPLAYEGLKRALKNRVVEIESLAEAYGMFATRTLDPEPIPLNTKVVLVGDPLLYYLLYQYDPDFQDLFKVKVDFAVRTDWTSDTAEQYAQFIGNICREENLKHFDPSGVARVVEHGARMVSDKEKLVTKFGEIVDLIRQANYWASRNGHDLVTGDDVKQAIEEKVYRSNQIEEILQEMIERGTILIDTDGASLGQVNGIAVLTLGDYAFGKPSRVTARAYVGTSGVVNIDRETELGGRIHNKGVMILTGYLGGKYALDLPLALSASVTFEQVYEEVEGDSAASTELYSLLSSLSGFPIRQDLAVTGSVNQYGRVQAIGGVNEKVEGYFDVCRLKGLTGNQGVLIPASNVTHLMLREDVVEAVRDGKFHIYPIATIDEGISVLTGKDAGERQPDGAYPKDTVNWAVQQTLQSLAQKVKDYVGMGPQQGGQERKRAA